jgi:hypothetical protein
MSTLISAAVVLALVAVVVALLERAHRHESGLPHPPLGGDPSCDTDLRRVLHDLDARRV